MEFTFTGIKQAVEPDPPALISAKHPVMSPDGRALWNGDEAWVWVMPETDDETFYCYLDAEGSTPGWFRFLDDCDGFHNALFPDETSGDEMAKALLEMGVAPDQPFFIHMTFAYYRGDGWTTDDEMILEWEVRDIEPLDPTVAAERWADWLGEWRKEP